MSYRIATWTAADQDRVLALIVDIQRSEFGLGITAADQPDLTDVEGFYQSKDLDRDAEAGVGRPAG